MAHPQCKKNHSVISQRRPVSIIRTIIFNNKQYLLAIIHNDDVQIYEIKYFQQLIGFIDNTIIKQRKWEEKRNLSDKEKNDCISRKRLCVLDPFHCGKKYKQIMV